MRIKKKLLTLVVIGVVAVLAAGCQCGATDTILAPETAMALYENTEHGFSIEYPEGWAENAYGAAISFILQCNEPEGRLSVSVTVEYRPEGISLADVVAEGKKYMESGSPLEMFSEGDVTISDGIPAYEMIGQGDVGTGRVEKFRYIILVRDKQVFWVGISGEPDQFDERERLVNSVVDSFKLLPGYTYVPPAPSPGGTYTSAEYGFSITYPAGWSDYTTGQYGEILDLGAAGGIPEVMIRAWTEETTLDESASMLKNMFSEELGDYEFLSESEITLDDGTPAYEIVFNGTMNGYLLTCKYVIVSPEANGFLIMGVSLPGSFEQDEPVLDEVIGSFHLE